MPQRRGFNKGLRRVIFENPHNLCYMNASISAILAMIDAASMPSPRVLQDIPARARVNLMQALGLHLTGWRRPREQHDAAEFCVFVLNSMSMGRHLAAWQGTIQEGERIHAHDSGAGCPIPLSYPPNILVTPRLQHFVYAWHHQEAMYRVCAARPTYLQLPRFRVDSDGVISKHSFQVSLRGNADRRLLLPCSGAQNSTAWTPYSLIAVVFHLGRTVDTGHYATALFEDEAISIRDDGVTARAASQGDLDTVEHNAYLAFVIPAHSAG